VSTAVYERAWSVKPIPIPNRCDCATHADAGVELVEGGHTPSNEVLLDLDRYIGQMQVVAQSIPIAAELGADAGEEELGGRHRWL
jgi:hypothetical protein